LEDEDAQKVLRNVRQAMSDGGRALLVDEIVARGNEPGGKTMDVLMLSIGGKERTEEEWRALLAASGFALGRVWREPVTVLEAVQS
jgi:hypothetical protein